MSNGAVNEEKCLNCRFFGTEIISGLEAPVCRRYAPRIISGVGENFSGQRFPVVYGDMWCGEWQKDEAERFSEVKNEQ